jgi:hypothetical protein
LFAKYDQIFTLNIYTSEIKTIIELHDKIDRQPHFFKPNVDQDTFIISSPEESQFVNLSTNEQTDIDAIYNITMIRGILYDRNERQYYILANKHFELLGFYIIKVSEQDPSDFVFLIKWTNKLDIGDPNLYIL